MAAAKKGTARSDFRRGWTLRFRRSCTGSPRPSAGPVSNVVRNVLTDWGARLAGRAARAEGGMTTEAGRQTAEYRAWRGDEDHKERLT